MTARSASRLPSCKDDLFDHCSRARWSVHIADGNWSLAQVKAKFSELVEKAKSEGPQHVSRNGKEVVVVVSAAEWDRRTKSARTMLEFLERSPLKGSNIDLERRPDFGRDARLQ